MRRPSIPRLLLLPALLALAAPLVLVSAPVEADVPHTQQVVLKGDRPVSGRYTNKFTNYYEAAYGYCGGNHCDYLGKRVARGTLSTKLATYRLKEGLRKFDYYLLDVDTLVQGKSGSSTYGWADVYVKTTGARVVDSTETKSVKARRSACDAIQLGLSTPWPVLSASATIGSVEFCSTGATFNRNTAPAGNETKYAANRLARINHLTVNRWVKVRAGDRPRFSVRVAWASDRCTEYDDDWCQEYDNGSDSATYAIGTRG